MPSRPQRVQIQNAVLSLLAPLARQEGFHHTHDAREARARHEPVFGARDPHCDEDDLSISSPSRKPNGARYVSVEGTGDDVKLRELWNPTLRS